MRMRSSYPVGLLFVLLWALMVGADFYASWFVLPDVVVIVALYFFLFVPQLPLWRWLLPVSLLMDVASTAPLGFHALFYTLTALMSLPFPGVWRMAAPAVSVLVLCLLAFALQVLRCLMLFAWQGVPAPPGWLWGGALALLCLPFLRWLADRAARRVLGDYV